MPILRFEGYSDDTFGEVEHTKDDYDNCASGKPIEYLVAHRESGMGVVVTGQHCPGNSGSWLIGTVKMHPECHAMHTAEAAGMGGGPWEFTPFSHERPARDCGEAGHDEGRCGNASCLGPNAGVSGAAHK